MSRLLAEIIVQHACYACLHGVNAALVLTASPAANDVVLSRECHCKYGFWTALKLSAALLMYMLLPASTLLILTPTCKHSASYASTTNIDEDDCLGVIPFLSL